jgi:hypothetical protein
LLLYDSGIIASSVILVLSSSFSSWTWLLVSLLGLGPSDPKDLLIKLAAEHCIRMLSNFWVLVRIYVLVDTH